MSSRINLDLPPEFVVDGQSERRTTSKSQVERIEGMLSLLDEDQLSKAAYYVK